MRSNYLIIILILYNLKIGLSNLEYHAALEGSFFEIDPHSCNNSINGWFIGDAKIKNSSTGSLKFHELRINDSNIYKFCCFDYCPLIINLIIIGKGHSFDKLNSNNTNYLLINKDTSFKCVYQIYSSSNMDLFKVNLTIRVNDIPIKTDINNINHSISNLNNKEIMVNLNISKKYNQKLKCILLLLTKEYNIFYNYTKELNIPIAYPVENVRPSKQEITIGEELKCLSDAYPLAKNYSWKDISINSSDSKFITFDNGSLIFMDSGIYSLQCTAFNIIDTNKYYSSWEGQIHVITYETFYDRQMKEQSLKIALIIGICSVFLFIGICIIVIFRIINFRKKNIENINANATKRWSDNSYNNQSIYNDISETPFNNNNERNSDVLDIILYENEFYEDSTILLTSNI